MKGAIFDMDGTLVDSMPYWGENFIKKLDDEGISYPDDVLNIITPMGIRRGSEYIHELGCPKTPEVIYNEVESAMLVEYLTNIPAKEGALEYVTRLKDEGVKICVLSASTHKMIEASTKKCGFYDLAEFIMSCDEMNMSKSNPMIFKLIAEKLGVPVEEITVFDDNSIAVKSAKQSGAKVCAVYDNTSAEYEDELKEIADSYIYSFKELL